MVMATTIRQSITLTRPQHEWLKAESERLGITIADLIRRLIDETRVYEELYRRRRDPQERKG